MEGMKDVKINNKKEGGGKTGEEGEGGEEGEEGAEAGGDATGTDQLQEGEEVE